MLELLTDHTFRTVCLGTAIVGGVSGALGCFAYLRKQSLVGDVVSHSSLLGIMLFFLVGYFVTGEGSKSLLLLVPGAILAGVAALVMTRSLVKRNLVRADSGLGVMLAVFFGSGVLLLRFVQRVEPAIPGRRGLQDYIFGMAAAMTLADLLMIVCLGFASIGIMLASWSQLKVFTFDPQFSQGLGLPTKRLDTMLIGIMVVGIVIGIQCVGVVLMIALLITPAAAARQWTRTLGSMVILAALFGAMGGVAGSVVSAFYSQVPTGPVVVLTITIIFILSLIVAPGRGVISKWLRRNESQKKSTDNQLLLASMSSQESKAT